jgi:hypothetical protein
MQAFFQSNAPADGMGPTKPSQFSQVMGSPITQAAITGGLAALNPAPGSSRTSALMQGASKGVGSYMMNPKSGLMPEHKQGPLGALGQIDPALLILLGQSNPQLAAALELYQAIHPVLT